MRAACIRLLLLLGPLHLGLVLGLALLPRPTVLQLVVVAVVILLETVADLEAQRVPQPIVFFQALDQLLFQVERVGRQLLAVEVAVVVVPVMQTMAGLEQEMPTLLAQVVPLVVVTAVLVT